MDFEFLSELDDIKTQLELYLERVIFIDGVADDDRDSFSKYEGCEKTVIDRGTTFREIINDYLWLIKEKVDSLNTLVNRMYEQKRAQKQNEAE